MKADENERLCQKVGILTARLDKTRKSDEHGKEDNIALLREV